VPERRAVAARVNPGRVALAAMTKAPIAGAVKTRLCPPLRPAEAAELARCFLEDRVEQLGAVPAGDRLGDPLGDLLLVNVAMVHRLGRFSGPRRPAPRLSHRSRRCARLLKVKQY
jgi:hypothetical protein